MPSLTKRQIRIIVASPSDVRAERDALPAVIEELNKGLAAELDLSLELFRWETDAFPSFHTEGPQGLIDSVLHIEEADIVIGIFWKRFGTVTKDGLTGTEHELRIAYDVWKSKGRPQILVYFNQKATNPKTKEELDQLSKVFEFRSNFPKEGLWWNYRNRADFTNLARKHLTSVLRAGLRNRRAEDDRSIFLHEYRKRLSGLYNRWDLSPVGVTETGGAKKPIELQLDEMYLPLRLASGYDVATVDKGTIYSPLALMARDKSLVLRGIGGAGKTTWMRWTFRALLKDPEALPIMVELRRLAACWTSGSVTGEQRSLDSYLRDWLSEYVDSRWIPRLQEILLDDDGPRPILLVDGWDELGPLGEELRSKLVGFMAAYPRILSVVTSRPYGESRPSHSDGFDVLDVQPLSDSEIQVFAENFYRRCYGPDTRATGESVSGFLNALDRSPDATSLARTPLLLTMMLLISRSSPLPDKRHLLYYKCVENLLTALPDRRQEEGALLTETQWRPDDTEERFRVVATLAFRVQEFGYSPDDANKPQSNVSVQWKRRLILFGWEHAKKDLPDSWRDEQKDRFVRWLIERAGLLVDRADGTVSFAHLSFQEFLVAWYLHTTLEGDTARADAAGGLRTSTLTAVRAARRIPGPNSTG